MKRIMMEGVEVDGKKMYLANFGIGTLNYFVAADNERNAYHIDGDPDDENTANNPDKLKSMIANDPDTVVSFFTQLSQKMSDKMFDMMKSVEGVSSAMDCLRRQAHADGLRQLYREDQRIGKEACRL